MAENIFFMPGIVYLGQSEILKIRKLFGLLRYFLCQNMQKPHKCKLFDYEPNGTFVSVKVNIFFLQN